MSLDPFSTRLPVPSPQGHHCEIPRRPSGDKAVITVDGVTWLISGFSQFQLGDRESAALGEQPPPQADDRVPVEHVVRVGIVSQDLVQGGRRSPSGTVTDNPGWSAVFSAAPAHIPT